ncbi:hypothetical protein ACF3OH_04070 [Chryseomicrobium aureum]|uniref:hypothetical protein n=1 Tax=Chryseomicrobium aureum TaxID=1441723 RepID=UPI00195E2B26|nr:hypothetical protein [Chryseomicrobium aureum]MBM7707390.1 hypothetical protein [Chryseomicrobium aureum]
MGLKSERETPQEPATREAHAAPSESSPGTPLNSPQLKKVPSLLLLKRRYFLNAFYKNYYFLVALREFKNFLTIGYTIGAHLIADFNKLDFLIVISPNEYHVTDKIPQHYTH